MTELGYKGYTGSLEASIEDDCLHGRILWIDDIVTYEGATLAEVRAAFEAAVDRYIAHCARVGKNPNKPFSGTFNVRVGSALHAEAAKAAHARGVKLNEFVKLAVQAAIESNGVVTHEHRHRHQHDLNVTLKAGQEAVTLIAGMGTPAWQAATTTAATGAGISRLANVKPH